MLIIVLKIKTGYESLGIRERASVEKFTISGGGMMSCGKTMNLAKRLKMGGAGMALPICLRGPGIITANSCDGENNQHALERNPSV